MKPYELFSKWNWRSTDFWTINIMFWEFSILRSQIKHYYYWLPSRLRAPAMTISIRRIAPVAVEKKNETSRVLFPYPTHHPLIPPAFQKTSALVFPTLTLTAIWSSYSCFVKYHLIHICISMLPKRMYIPLMEEILHQWIGSCSLSHYLQGFIHLRWCRISSINRVHASGSMPRVFQEMALDQMGPLARSSEVQAQFFQWLFRFVPLIGGIRYHIIPQLAGRIPLIYHLYIANWVITWYLPPIKGTRNSYWSFIVGFFQPNGSKERPVVGIL